MNVLIYHANETLHYIINKLSMVILHQGKVLFSTSVNVHLEPHFLNCFILWWGFVVKFTLKAIHIWSYADFWSIIHRADWHICMACSLTFYLGLHIILSEHMYSFLPICAEVIRVCLLKVYKIHQKCTLFSQKSISGISLHCHNWSICYSITLTISKLLGIYYLGICNYGYIAQRLLPGASVSTTGSGGN